MPSLRRFVMQAGWNSLRQRLSLQSNTSDAAALRQLAANRDQKRHFGGRRWILIPSLWSPFSASDQIKQEMIVFTLILSISIKKDTQNRHCWYQKGICATVARISLRYPTQWDVSFDQSRLVLKLYSRSWFPSMSLSVEHLLIMQNAETDAIKMVKMRKILTKMHFLAKICRVYGVLWCKQAETASGNVYHYNPTHLMRRHCGSWPLTVIKSVTSAVVAESWFRHCEVRSARQTKLCKKWSFLHLSYRFPLKKTHKSQIVGIRRTFVQLLHRQ